MLFKVEIEDGIGTFTIQEEDKVFEGEFQGGDFTSIEDLDWVHDLVWYSLDDALTYISQIK